MNNFFDSVDKYKYGLIAALASYIFIFSYLQMETYKYPGTPYEPFHDGSYVEMPEDELELRAENIEVPSDYNPQDVKNIVKDANDTRKKAYENYYENKSSQKTVSDVYDLEKQMFKEAGGEAEREKIRREMENRKNSADSKNNKADKDPSTQPGGDVSFAGETMVEFYLKERNPHQNNRWYVRNPGYTCGHTSGKVVVDIRVNQSGNVTSATINANMTKGANSCMLEQALKYARMSRFNYSSSAGQSETGWISYTFVSQ